MKKKKQKPDFSKPKPEKKISPTKEELEEKVEESIALANASLPEVDADGIKSRRKSKTQKFFPDKTYCNLPLIVIAGRPNVGKSTLFNALTHTKRAITDPTPGVTRDPVEGTCFLDGMPVHLMDTGGYKLTRDFKSRESEMDDLVVEKTVQMLTRADRILLLLDATEITAEDEELILRLRPFWGKLVAAVNKTEGGKNMNTAFNYAKFGFNDLIFISASHGDNLPELQKHMIKGIDFSSVTEMTEEERAIRIAILGKPNTGKSTLSNALTHTEASIVSDYAGTTRDVVEGSFRYNGRDIQILDTAGIRRKAKVKENVEYYSVNRAIKTLDECDIAFIMIDAVEGLAEQDKKICSLAFEKGRGIIFVLNKWHLREEKDNKAVKSVREWMNIMFAHMDFAPILPLSALEGKGIKDLLNTAIEMYGQLTKKIGTSSLNNALQDWLERYPPPASKTAHFKIRYMTQASTNPVSFIIFATRPEVVPEPYVTYLKNRILEYLGYDIIPVQVEFKGSRQKWEDRER